MLTVGLTGSVASGKSTVAGMWKEEGVPVASADDFARRAVEPGSEGLRRVVEAFGTEVLSDDGSLDRAAVRRRVFENARERRRLEEILHPLIARRRERWLEELRRDGAPLAVAEIPLLFEAGVEDEFDVIVVVDAPEEERLRRLREDRGLTEEEARSIMAAQLDPGEKRRRADIVVDNGTDLQALRRKAGSVLEELRARAPGEAVRRLRIDLHLHTLASRDCLTDPEEVLERALAAGLDRIAITDHDEIEAALEMAVRHPDRVIPGEEVKTAEGVDVIGLYLQERIPGGTPARETCHRIREQGGLVYLPHPFAPGKGGSGELAEELAPELDVVEVFNSRLHRAMLNHRARELADRHGLPGGAGSDAHSLGEVGRGFVEVPRHANRPEALLEALGSARIHGRESPRWVHLHSTWAKVRKRLPGSVSVDAWKERTAR